MLCPYDDCGLEVSEFSSFKGEDMKNQECKIQHQHSSQRHKNVCLVESKHNPTPWHISEEGFIMATDIQSIHSVIDDVAISKEDAAFIVRAVNSHEALLEVAKDALCYYIDLYPDRPEPIFHLWMPKARGYSDVGGDTILASGRPVPLFPDYKTWCREVALKHRFCELDPDCNFDGSNYKGEPSDKGNSRIQTILALYKIIAQAEAQS